MNNGGLTRPRWRPMQARDLPGVHALSTRIHPDFPERPEVLAEKSVLFPRGCFVLDRAGAPIHGYCFSHPWHDGSPPALDTMLDALPEVPATYFIHDLALDPAMRGQNLAAALVPALLAIARSVPVSRTTLVAVSGSTPFWTRAGFAPTNGADLQRAAQEKYGAGAVHMTRELNTAQD